MKRYALAVGLAMMSAVTLADTVGTYAAGDGQHRKSMVVSYKDDQHIRMDVGQGNYLLVSGAKVYMVTGQGGRTMVMDMDSLPKFALPSASKQGSGDVKVTKTSRTETIAGLKGDVYEILVDGQKHEAVISMDRRAQGLNKAMTALAKRMGQSLGADTSAQIEAALREAHKYGTGGLLRSDQAMVLQEIAEKSQPAGYYELPAGATPMQMPQLPQMDPAAMQQMQERMQQMMRQQQGR